MAETGKAVLHIQRTDQESPAVDRRFSGTFRLGRGAECEIQLESDVVSRTHVEIRFEDGGWLVADLNSTNGTFVNGQRIQNHKLERQCVLQMGKDGPRFKITLEGDTASTSRFRSGPKASVDHYIEHYLKTRSDADAGEHTIMIRKAFATVQKKQRRRYGWIVGAAVGVAALLLGFVIYQQALISRQRRAASELFVEMKTLDLRISQLREVIESTGNAQLRDQLKGLEESRQAMSKRYDGYIKELGVYRKLNEKEKIIYKMARVFNESEFGMPAAFADSVQKMIESYWLTPAGRGRFIRSVERARDRNYTSHIVRTMQRYGLPAQFYYLALQESNLDPEAIGPQTRWGRAKGMWQFIPATAARFDLDPGVYTDQNMVDRLDERHNFQKSTVAAARYLHTIYSTLAQASGLLVVASYNWGEHRIVNRLEDLPGPQTIPVEAFEGIPEDPDQRNYWRFLGEYADRMPVETRDYVLKIFAAAVIGENPRLFGFDMDNPLAPYMEWEE
jgi:hypothetical protein